MIFNKYTKRNFLLFLLTVGLLVTTSLLAYFYLNSPKYLAYHRLKPNQFTQIENKEYKDEVTDILNNEIGINKDTPDLTKLEKISGYAISKVWSQRGSPIRPKFYETPYEGWVKTTNGETEIYCSHFCDFVSMFAKEAGLLVRKVHTRHIKKYTEDNTNYYRHVVLEVFIDGQWVMSDPYFRVIYIKKGDQFLNAHQFLNTKNKDLLEYHFAIRESSLVNSMEFSEMITSYKNRFFNSDINKLVFPNIVDSEEVIEIYSFSPTSFLTKYNN
ncbi:MAG: hypothetical protein U9O78_02290 [Patescibacteria group bacterium]|nr:hypothetical protein [Patescibacteria group bacterium]